MIKSKLPKVGTTIFSVMSAMSQEHNAINLSQGFPDFECDNELIKLVSSYMRKGMNQYAPMPGILKLRERIAEKTEKLYNARYHPETEVTVTSGGTQALYTAIAATINEGDEVLIFEPAYDSYGPAVQMQGGMPVYMELKYPGYTIDWEEVKKRINTRTKLIILNSPHNPTGSILSENDIRELINITKNTDILILSDEVYEHLLYDGRNHLSMALYPELRERSFIIASFGKVLHTTGWKLGYCLAPAMLMAEFRKVHQFMVFCSNTPMQYAIADYLGNEDTYLHLSAFYMKKRDYFDRMMRQTKFDLLPAYGSYFQCATYRRISDEGDKEFATRLTKEFGVAAIPNSAFYHNNTDNHVLRFCFAKKEKTLEQAVARLMRI